MLLEEGVTVAELEAAGENAPTPAPWPTDGIRRRAGLCEERISARPEEYRT
jgi:hypothetical protein